MNPTNLSESSTCSTSPNPNWVPGSILPFDEYLTEPVDTIFVHFHITYKDNGSGGPDLNSNIDINAEPTNIDRWLRERIKEVNDYLGNLGQETYPNTPGGYIPDARVRLEYTGYSSHVHNTHWDPQWHPTHSANDKWVDLVQNDSGFTNSFKYNTLHVFLGGDTSFTIGGHVTTRGDNSMSLGGWMQEWVSFKNNGYRWENDSNPYKHTVACKNLIHELGHCMGLAHNFYNQACASGKCFGYTSACDYVHNNFKFDHDVHLPLNYMAYNPQGWLITSFTELQYNKIHWYLSQYSGKKIASCVKSKCYQDVEPYPVPSWYVSPDIIYNSSAGQNRTIDFEKTIYGDFIIESNVTVTLTCTLRMAPGSRIIIDNAAKLIVDGGVITNLDECSKKWYGIEVHGNPGAPQTSNLQGRLIMQNGAIISNAFHAVHLGNYNVTVDKGGGIIDASDSKFINNNRAVSFDPYIDYDNSGNEIKNYSSITYCEFETNTDYIDIYSRPDEFVNLKDVNYVRIGYCSFKNLCPDSYFPNTTHKNRGKGVEARDASFGLYGSQFEGLSVGVESKVISKIPKNYFSQNDFKDCWHGLEVRACEFTEMNRNEFDDCRIGAYLRESKGFGLSQNDFLHNHDDNQMGVYLRDLTDFTNQVYRNEFEDLDVGIVSSSSINSSNTGLVFKCNEFEPTTISKADIALNAGWVSPAQGGCMPGSPEPVVHPAGNKFSQTPPCGSNVYDFYTHASNSGTIVYSHHNQTTGSLVPECQGLGIVNNPCVVQYSVLACPDRYFNNGLTPVEQASKYSQVRTRLTDGKTQWDGQQASYDALVDGGSTQTLLTFIQDANNTSQQVLGEVDQYSPYLSDDILTACLERDPELAESDLYSILDNNKPFTDGVYSLVQSSSVLDQSKKDYFEGEQTGISDREEFELDILAARQFHDAQLNNLMRHFLLDTNIGDPLDSMISTIENHGSDPYLPSLIKLYWQKQDFEESMIVLNEMAGIDGFEHLHFIYSRLDEMVANDEDLDYLAADSIVLDSIANDTTITGYVLARNILEYLMDEDWVFDDEEIVINSQEEEGGAAPQEGEDKEVNVPSVV